MEGEWSCYGGDQFNGGRYYDCKKFGRGVHLKERGHYECKIWGKYAKERTLTAKFDRGMDLQGREDIMTQKVWKSFRFKVGREDIMCKIQETMLKQRRGEGIMVQNLAEGQI